jgi:hypothetical protein
MINRVVHCSTGAGAEGDSSLDFKTGAKGTPETNTCRQRGNGQLLGPIHAQSNPTPVHRNLPPQPLLKSRPVIFKALTKGHS